MLKSFTKYIIGGRSGKREAAWFVFLLWSIAFGWSAWREAHGFPVSGVQSMLTTAMPFVLGFLLSVHGMDWVSKQTNWGGEPNDDDTYPPVG